MGAGHVNIYLNLIEALLHCAKGEEWLLLQQHEELIDAELLTVMAQVAEQLNAEGNDDRSSIQLHLTHCGK